METQSWPKLGCGVGLRSKHYPVITSTWPQIDWLEAISENYMDSGGKPLRILEEVRRHYPIALHGTSLSIGSADPLNLNYLLRLKKLVQRIDPFIVSDHLCWSGIQGEQLHDLLPLPFTEEAIEHLIPRIQHLQEFLGRRILLENVSTYVTYHHSVMPEWEFLNTIAKRSGCGILFDVNNAYVNSFNHKFDPYEYLRNVSGELIGQIHLAGHTDMGSFLFDTHAGHVIDPVWDLYHEALKLWGPVSTLIEWDADIPEFEILAKEAEKARKIYQEYEKQPIEDLSGHSQASFDRHPERSEESLRFFGLQPQNGGFLRPSPLLCETQQWMKLRIQPQIQPPAPSTQSLLNPQGGVSGEKRMEVYAAGYLARIHESLDEVYKTIHSLLGNDAFVELARGYAHRYFSHDYNLNLAGRHLPDFLKDHPLTAQFPFLPDLAKFEWLVTEAFHAFDQSPLDPREFVTIPIAEWETAKIIFQPSVKLTASSWAIYDLWKARHNNPEETKKMAWNRPQWVLVGRKEVQVRCEPLTKTQYQLLEGLLAGKSLGAVCGELSRDSSSSEQDLPIGEWFARWVADGLIHRCEFSKNLSPHSCC